MSVSYQHHHHHHPHHDTRIVDHHSTHSMHTWPSPAKLTEYHHPACSWLQDQDQNTQSVQKIMLILIKQYKTVHIFSAVMSPFSNNKQTDNSLENVLHWNITYSVCVCVSVCAHTCAEVCVLTCVRVRAGVWMWVWVVFRWCRWVYISNYACFCMSVLLFAYVCMLPTFETLSLL